MKSSRGAPVESRGRDAARVAALLRSEVDGRILLLGIATVATVVLGGALTALSPLVLKSLIDVVASFSGTTDGAHVRSLSLQCIEYLLLLVAGRALADIRPLLSGTINQRLHCRVTQRFFTHAARLPMAYLVTRRGSELLHTLDLASAGAQMVIVHLSTGFLPVLVELGTMVLVLIHLGQPAIVTVYGVAALAYLTVFTVGARRMRRASDDVSSASLEAYARLGDAVTHIETLRCFTAEPQASHRIAAANTLVEQRWLSLNGLSGMIAAGACLIFAFSMAACLFWSATAVAEHTMTVGGFVLTTVYMLQMVQPLDTLGTSARDLARSFGCMRPFLDLLSEPLSPGAGNVDRLPSTAASTPRPPSSVRVENLHFSYAPDRPLLKGVTFDVPAGSTTAIVGESGSGKSSLVRLLMRLYEPQCGRILIGDRAIDSICTAELRTSLVSLVPQETALLHDTIYGNIALGSPAASRDDVALAASAAQLEKLLEGLPQGLHTPVGEQGMQLSGGERQRVGIARALLRRPSLYLLDEPTSALDGKTELDVLRAVRRLAQGATTIVIAHRLSTIVDADEILVLDDGRIHERGSHQALMAAGGIYARMWRQQTHGPSS